MPAHINCSVIPLPTDTFQGQIIFLKELHHYSLQSLSCCGCNITQLDKIILYGHVMDISNHKWHLLIMWHVRCFIEQNRELWCFSHFLLCYVFDIQTKYLCVLLKRRDTCSFWADACFSLRTSRWSLSTLSYILAYQVHKTENSLWTWQAFIISTKGQVVISIWVDRTLS